MTSVTSVTPNTIAMSRSRYGIVLRQTEHGRHRQGAFHVAEDHDVLPAPGHALAGHDVQEAETAVDRDRPSHVQRDHGQRDEPGLAEQQVRSELHADEQEQPHVDDERGDFPEALKRQHACRLEPLAHLVADQHARHDDRDDGRSAEVLRQERRREDRHDRGQHGRQFIGRASENLSRPACRTPCREARRRRSRRPACARSARDRRSPASRPSSPRSRGRARCRR